MESLTCGQRLWRGRVTAVENIVFFIPFWLWLGCVVYIALRRLPEEVLHYTFFPVALASTLPFFFSPYRAPSILVFRLGYPWHTYGDCHCVSQVASWVAMRLSGVTRRCSQPLVALMRSFHMTSTLPLQFMLAPASGG
jgi:hypothetical protein